MAGSTEDLYFFVSSGARQSFKHYLVLLGNGLLPARQLVLVDSVHWEAHRLLAAEGSRLSLPHRATEKRFAHLPPSCATEMILKCICDCS